jgi:hypothetical protein
MFLLLSGSVHANHFLILIRRQTAQSFKKSEKISKYEKNRREIQNLPNVRESSLNIEETAKTLCFPGHSQRVGRDEGVRGISAKVEIIFTSPLRKA